MCHMRFWLLSALWLWSVSVNAGTVSGRLEQTDDLDETGQPVDWHEIEVSAGQRLQVTLRSDDMDTLLLLEDTLGHVWTDDDRGGGTNSHLVVDVLEDGLCLLGVRAAQALPKQGADWRLSWDVTEQEVLILSPPAEADGQLEVELEAAQPAHMQFAAQRKQPVVVSVSGWEKPGLLTVQGPGGFYARAGVPMFSETPKEGLKLAFLPPLNGNYHARFEGPEGACVIHLNRAAPRSALGDWAVGDGGRVRGVFVGISEYTDTRASLRFCAQDAISMSRAFQRRFAMADEDVHVLTDNLVTLEGLRETLAEVGDTCQPEDLLVFFYSGHGHQRQVTPGAQEPDGWEEVLKLHDMQELSDDALAELINRSPARHALVVMDCCHSGGFSREIVSRPGRLGLFSSDGDCLSMVARKLSSGGFLSHFVRLAMTSHAMHVDLNGDGLVTAHELTQHLRNEFETNLTSRMFIQPESAPSGPFIAPIDESWQRPILNRDAVSPHLILWGE